MKAVGLYAHHPADHPDALVDLEIESPVPGPRDLLVKVEAVSVNPIDAKMRAAKPKPPGSARILGWDAAGTVVATGADVERFRVGDPVFYAGAINRPGCNSEHHVVDERIVGPLPTTIGFAAAAALPLTSITAWECLFDRMAISTEGRHRGRTLLVIGGAGGVGSIAIQLAKAVAGLSVVATASRAASQTWCRTQGADAVVDHREPLGDAVRAVVSDPIDYMLCTRPPDPYFEAIAEIIAPQGRIACIADSLAPLPMNALRGKSVTFCWEGMFTRSTYGTADLIEQHRLLERVASLVDAGRLRSTMRTRLGEINAENLRAAHRQIESAGTIGKIVISGWPG